MRTELLSKAGLSSLRCQKFLQMGFYRFRERLQVVAAFQTADEPPLGVSPGDLQDALRERDEILDLQAERADRIPGVGVETGADQNELGFDLVGGLFQAVQEARVVVLAS